MCVWKNLVWMDRTFLFYSFFPYHLMMDNRNSTTVLSVAVIQNYTYKRTYLPIIIRRPFNFLPTLVLIRSRYNWIYSYTPFHVRWAGFLYDELKFSVSPACFNRELNIVLIDQLVMDSNRFETGLFFQKLISIDIRNLTIITICLHVKYFLIFMLIYKLIF